VKRFLIPLLTVLSLSSTVEAGEFNSQWEARKACDAWQAKGGNYIEDIPNSKYVHEMSIRSCKHEISTRQFIGFNHGNYKRNKKYTVKEVLKRFNLKPVKYFRY